MLHRRSPTVMLFGITPRSGTNYFYGLLRAHPQLDCVNSDRMPEDFLIYHSDLLLRYADLIATWWTQHWRPGRDHERTATAREESFAWVARCLGDGIEKVVAGPEPSGKTVVSKTPTVHNVDNVASLLPEAKILFLVRDGRDQTASAVRSYGKAYEFAMQRWAEAARTIIDFDARHRDDTPQRHLIVRYEDLVADVESALRPVFEFLDVDPDSYDYTVEERLPVMGSSQHLKPGESLRDEYRRVEKADGFDARGRWASWPAWRLWRFNYVAGAEMEHFGYELAGRRPRVVPLQQVLDVPFRLRTAVLRSLRDGERLATAVARFRQKAISFSLRS